MKKILLTLLLALTIARADTNILELTWMQPAGYQSALFYSTNLNGTWQTISTNPPPFFIAETQSAAFFYVQVFPTNPFPASISGNGDPTAISAPTGTVYIDTNSRAFWVKMDNVNSNGWSMGWSWGY